jgi:hypothetical protein
MSSEIIDIIKKIDCVLKNLFSVIAEIRKSGTILLESVKNCCPENCDNYFKNLKTSFSNYYENIMNIYNSTQIKNTLDNLNEKINYFVDKGLNRDLFLNQELTMLMGNYDYNNPFYSEFNVTIDENPDIFKEEFLKNTFFIQ